MADVDYLNKRTQAHLPACAPVQYCIEVSNTAHGGVSYRHHCPDADHMIAPVPCADGTLSKCRTPPANRCWNYQIMNKQMKRIMVVYRKTL